MVIGESSIIDRTNSLVTIGTTNQNNNQIHHLDFQKSAGGVPMF